MTREDILEMFKNEEFDKAVFEIKNALRSNPDNGELIYYLFLAENKDYTNIDLDNIVNEVNFNRALELSGRRLKNQFEAEYNFYKNSDAILRKLLRYSSIRDVKKVLDNIYDIKKVNFSRNNLFLDDLDYIILNDLNEDSLRLNLLIVNYLYVLTNEERLISIYKNLINVISMADKKYVKMEIAETETEIDGIISRMKEEIANNPDETIKREIGNNVKYAIDLFNNKEYSAAIDIFSNNIDDKEAKFYYGKCRLFGLGTRKDIDSGFNYVLSSAYDGYVPAQYELGNLYATGYGGKFSEEEAFRWFEKAANNNYEIAYYNLGWCYETGFGCATNIKMAIETYKKGTNNKECIDRLRNIRQPKNDKNNQDKNISEKSKEEKRDNAIGILLFAVLGLLIVIFSIFISVTLR